MSLYREQKKAPSASDKAPKGTWKGEKTMYYYGVYSYRTRKVTIYNESSLDCYLMTGDNLLFDTEERCREYWQSMGYEVEG